MPKRLQSTAVRMKYAWLQAPSPQETSARSNHTCGWSSTSSNLERNWSAFHNPHPVHSLSCRRTLHSCYISSSTTTLSINTIGRNGLHHALRILSYLRKTDLCFYSLGRILYASSVDMVRARTPNISSELTTYFINFNASDLPQIVQNCQSNDKHFVQPTQHVVPLIKKAKKCPLKPWELPVEALKLVFVQR